MLRKRIQGSDLHATRPINLRIDCGYRPNGVIRMFHAVSLDERWTWPKCWRLARQSWIAGRNPARGRMRSLELTAIVEPLGAWRGKTAEKDSVETRRRSIFRIPFCGRLRWNGRKFGC